MVDVVQMIVASGDEFRVRDVGRLEWRRYKPLFGIEEIRIKVEDMLLRLDDEAVLS